MHNLSTDVANQLRRAPHVRNRFPHLPIVRDQDIPQGETREDAQHMQDYERHTIHLEQNYANQIRTLSDHPPNTHNSQDGGTDRPPRPPIPGSESEHESE